MGCLIIFKSITYAQKACDMLSKCGIRAQLIRPPAHLGHGSCSYALKIPHANCDKLAGMLSGCGVSGLYTLSPSGAVVEVGA